MATKKVEEESVKRKKATNKSVAKDKKNVVTSKSKTTKKAEVDKDVKKKTKTVTKKVTKEKNEKEEKELKDKLSNEVAVEKIVCEECGKKYLASLDKCPKCGYSIHDKKKTFYDDEDEEEYEEDEEEYDDEDEYEEPVIVKKDKKEKQKEKFKGESNKETKKNKKQKYVNSKSSFFEQNEDFFNLIKILVSIVLIVGIVYLIVAFLNGEFKKDVDNEEDSEVAETIQNEKILASSIFKKADEEYYVLIYDGSSEWADYYGMIYDEYSYIDDEDAAPLFWVDLSNRFNRDIIVAEDEETNSNAQEYSELKVKSPTLIHIEDGENVDYYEGDEAVSTLKDVIASYNED